MDTINIPKDIDIDIDKEKEQNAILLFFYTNLDTITKIEDGHKLYINVSNMIVLDEPYMFQGIWRYCSNISRKDAIYVLNKLINDIEIYFNALYVKNFGIKTSGTPRLIKIDEIDHIAFKTIIEKLTKSTHGIVNLKKTYNADIETCNELSKIIDKINSLVFYFSKLI